ncbi:MAG: pyruvate kinase [Syntrophobacterales bacterium]|nr:pyruvate kinase [Syntrophobacterales bacterium]
MVESKWQRKTKIVATLGPTSRSPEMIRELIRAGVDVFRLNFSHGSRSEHEASISWIRKIAKDENTCVGILQDLRGPKIRLGELYEESLELTAGSRVYLVPIDKARKDPTVLPIDYHYLVEDVKEGDRILLADGTMELMVEKVLEDSVLAEVIVGGVVRSHKGVNLPSSALRIPAFTEKDREDLELGLSLGVDFVALSFIRHENDVKPLREMIQPMTDPPMIIGKIEKPQAVARLDEILDVVDGVMVARGDLGVEMKLEDVPIIQKRIINAARRRSKPVITATQMLLSMVNNPRPTRAETSDVANAIIDGADAVMLSEETATGSYPLEAVKVLNRVACATEKVLEYFLRDSLLENVEVSIENAISRSAWEIAKELKASAIVASTASGKTARLVSRFRPSIPVVAVTHKEKTFRQLSLSWGIVPTLTKPFASTDEMFREAEQWVVEHKIANSGDKIIVTAGIPVGQMGTTNLIRVIEVGRDERARSSS